MILSESIVDTLRDVQRLTSTFHILRSMLIGEVDWIDLLAYAALVTKAPEITKQLSIEPEIYLNQPLSLSSVVRSMAMEKMTLEERLGELVPDIDRNDGKKELLKFLFPWLSEPAGREPDHIDPLCKRVPLLTTLRLGLLPGTWSRERIQDLVRGAQSQITAQISQAYSDGTLESLSARLSDLYLDLAPFDDFALWRAVGDFAKKGDCEWIESYQPIGAAIREFAEILFRAVRKNQSYRGVANAVFLELDERGETELTTIWLRHHFFVHEIYGRKRHDLDVWFLTAKETESFARERAERWRVEHLQGRLIPCRWDAQPIFMMIDMELWDDACRESLDGLLDDDRAIDGFTLMLFGGVYSVGASTMRQICNYQKYVERAKGRLNAGHGMHETVRVALKKLVDGLF